MPKQTMPILNFLIATETESSVTSKELRESIREKAVAHARALPSSERSNIIDKINDATADLLGLCDKLDLEPGIAIPAMCQAAAFIMGSSVSSIDVLRTGLEISFESMRSDAEAAFKKMQEDEE